MENLPQNPAVKRTRASGPKVRTGCLTCKSRHVKCDERKPECIRCSSTGRKCEGYLHLERKRSESGSGDESSSPSSSSLVVHTSFPSRSLNRFPNQSPKELRSIELFLHKAAPQLSGFFQQPFWNFVLQVSFDEVSIRHALVAVSAVYEQDVLSWDEPENGTAALKKLSLDYYNRAIRSMVKKMQEKDSVIVPILGCILFVCFEFLRRDISAAINHIDGGIKMIEQARVRRKDALSTKVTNPKIPDYENEIVERVMAPLISSLNCTATVFGRPRVHFNLRENNPAITEREDGKLCNMEDAMATLLDFINNTMDFLRTTGHKRYTIDAVEMEDYKTQEQLVKQLNAWRENFDELDAEDTEVSPSQRKARNLLRTVQKTAHLWLVGACTPYESAWDQYKTDFEEILALVEDIVQDASQFANMQSKMFSFELGIIPPLSLIIRKCRYPIIRRRALALLKAYPRRECLFDSFYAVLLDERVIEMEEACFKLAPGCLPAEDQLPPEHERIHLVFFAYDEVPGVDGWLVSFLSKPHGVRDDWFVRRESIDVVSSFKELKSSDAPQPFDIPKPKSKSSPVDRLFFERLEGSGIRTITTESPVAVTADA